MPQRNELYFTLNYRGYYATYKINQDGEGASHDLMKPNNTRVSFPELIQGLVEGFTDRFFVPGIKVIFDRHPKSHGAKYIPPEERKAIKYLVEYMEFQAKQKRKYENKLEKITEIAKGE